MNVEHRLTKLETDSEHIKKSLDEIKADLKPIKKHVLTLNAIMKFSSSALVIVLVKKLLGF